MICRLKEAPIYIIGQYIVVDEPACYVPKYGKGFNYRLANLKEYEKKKQEGLIETAFDFDNFFNPDLTLFLPFEKNKKNHDAIVQSLLYEIGTKWKERLAILFPENKYTIVQYYDSDNSEWYLDFYNGSRVMGDFEAEERIQNIVCIS
ncbi:MAG: hypothetical protein COA36_13215 [Desulfotalea sp.]|nr:MAG: hypothetical protein COA36_13215 [Desulfotalea sp.]